MRSIFLLQIAISISVTFIYGLLDGLFDWGLLSVFLIFILLSSYFFLGCIGIALILKVRDVKSNVFRNPLLSSSLLLVTIVPAVLIGTPIRTVGYRLGELLQPAFFGVMNRNIQGSQLKDYDSLLKLSNNDFIVRDVNGSLILTEEGYVFSLIGFYPEGDINEFNTYARSLLVKQPITFKLPAQDEFLLNYTHHSGIFYDVKNKEYMDIPAMVYFKNREISTTFHEAGY